MYPLTEPMTRLSPNVSPMSLSDRLITLAKEAEQAGFTFIAADLVDLALRVFDEIPRRRG